VNKKESIVLAVLVILLIVLNIISYLKREQIKRNTSIIAQEIAVKIPINSAWTEELELLPGIGPSLANRIVAYREEHGDFKRIEDLKKVKGIGDKVLKQINPYVKLQ
jgi:competence protein ComEA